MSLETICLTKSAFLKNEGQPKHLSNFFEASNFYQKELVTMSLANFLSSYVLTASPTAENNKKEILNIDSLILLGLDTSSYRKEIQYIKGVYPKEEQYEAYLNQFFLNYLESSVAILDAHRMKEKFLVEKDFEKEKNNFIFQLPNLIDFLHDEKHNLTEQNKQRLLNLTNIALGHYKKLSGTPKIFRNSLEVLNLHNQQLVNLLENTNKKNKKNNKIKEVVKELHLENTHKIKPKRQKIGK